MKTVIAKVNYFDIKAGDTLEVLSFHETGNDSCNFYKTVLPSTTKVHYMFTAEVE